MLEDANPAEFATWVPRLMERLQASPVLADVASDMQQEGQALDIVIDRATAARFGITPATVDNALYDLFGQRIVSTIYTQSNQYRVILEADPKIQAAIDGLKQIYLPSSSSTDRGQVPLSAIVHLERRSGPLQITHYGQFPATLISFNLAPGASLGEAVQAIRDAEAAIGLPDSFITAFQGAAAAFQASLANEALLLLAAIATVYIVLGVLYESFIHPDYDPLDPALGRRGRAAGADGPRLRPRRHRDHRHRAADRHREEERDHDDRLRARRRARGGARAARGDLRGVPAALPADPDDDDGGGARRIAADAGPRAPARSCAARSALRSSAG